MPPKQKREMTQQKIGELIRDVKSRLSENTIKAVLFQVRQVKPYLYGDWPLEISTMLWLHWICFYWSYDKMEKHFGIPHSTVFQLFGAIRDSLYGWAKSQVNGGTYENRLAIAQSANRSELFVDATLCIDGTQCRIWKCSDAKENESNLSFKNKGKLARNCKFSSFDASDTVDMVTCTFDGRITYVSPSFGSRRHDLYVLKRCIVELQRVTANGQDKILGDAGFVGANGIEHLNADVSFYIPHKKKKGSALNATQLDHNSQLSQERARIERYVVHHNFDSNYYQCFWKFENEISSTWQNISWSLLQTRRDIYDMCSSVQFRVVIHHISTYK